MSCLILSKLLLTKNNTFALDMKHKNILIASLATLLLAACGGNDNTYKVEAVVDNMPQGKFYLIDKMTNEVVDSAFVADGVIVYTQPVDTAYEAVIVDVTNVAPGVRYSINDTTIHFAFIAEPGGNLKIDLNKGEFIEASPLNIDYKTFSNAYKELNNRIQQLDDSLTQLIENKTLSLEDAENAFYTERDNLNAEYVEQLETMLATHPNDIVGAIVLNSFLSKCDDDERIDATLATMSDYVMEHPAVNKRVQRRIKLKETAEGMPFKDFSVEQEDGTTVSLSDYVGKGNYVLADFWASWCPPCRKSMPLLKELYNECHDKGLEILGLATRDKVKDSLRAIEEEQMTWPQILSDNSPAADTYGVNGIPHLILFAPDGTIALRGYPDEAFLNQVKELITKQ